MVRGLVARLHNPAQLQLRLPAGVLLHDLESATPSCGTCPNGSIGARRRPSVDLFRRVRFS